MNLKTLWQKLATAWQSAFSDKQKLIQKGVPALLAVVFICATGVTVLGVQNVKLNYSTVEEAKADLEADQKELAAALAEIAELKTQLAAISADMQALLEKAEQEGAAVSDKIDQLQSAYENVEDKQRQQWQLPMQYKKCTSPFGYRAHPVAGEAKFHYGVDLAADYGTPIVASRSGTIKVATFESNAGNYVDIDHLDGYMSRYMHMSKSIVTEGQFVVAGQIIGYCGSTGVSTGNHLHFGIYHNDESVNPADYIPMY